MLKNFFLSAVCLALGVSARASGYQVALQGQKQAGMGHTGTALAWDASSLFFNPGSLAFLKKSSIIGGASFISSTVGYVGPSPSSYQAETSSPIGTPFGAYIAIKVGSKLVVGFGAYTPYGSSIKWGEQFAYKNNLQELTLKSIVYQPTLSYKITDKIGIGAGLTINTGSVDLKKTVPVESPGNMGDTISAQVELKGKAKVAFGFNVGIHVQATERLSVGASYRSKVDAVVQNGDASYTGSVLPVLTGSFGIGGKTTFDATLPLPAVASVGIGYKATPALTLALDANYTFWSVYKELKFNFKDYFGTGTVSATPRNYKDVVAVRVGANYDVVKQLSLRAGGYYDLTPVKAGYMTLETPDADRIGLSFGVGIRPIENLHIDASLVMIFGQKRTQSQADINATGTATTYTNLDGTKSTSYSGGNVGAVAPGTYMQRAFIPGVSIGYNF